MNKVSVLFPFLLIGYVCGKSYNGYKVYEVIPETYEQADFLHTFSDNIKFDFWREAQTLGNPSDIMVAPNDQWYFKTELAKHGIKYKVVVENVESIIQENQIGRSLMRSAQLGDVTFKNYMFYEEMLNASIYLTQSIPGAQSMADHE